MDKIRHQNIVKRIANEHGGKRKLRKKPTSNERGTIEKMQLLAQTRGGKCISKKYVNAHTNLMWVCAKGHRWSAKPNNITSGHWCNKCVLIIKSVNAKKQWSNPSSRERITKGIIQSSKDPVLRSKRRAVALSRWKDSEFREKVIAAQSGPNNANWNPNRSQIVHRNGLGFLKSQVKRLLKKSCEWCGSSEKLQLDHIKPQ